jgi:glycosyltransferase involved in cell wall biosynthesis
VALFASILGGLPYSFTGHAKDIYTSHADQLREKMALARFAVTCTEANRRYLQTVAAGSAVTVHRVYHGIDVRLFRGAPAPSPSDGPCRVLTVARLTAKKGLPTVIRAVRRLREAGMNVRYELIGDGELRDPVLRTLRREGFDPGECWRGTLPHERVIAAYRGAHLFALGCEIAPNGDRDGIPNVLAESMAMGVPVVATNLSGIPELVEDGRSGLLVEPGNPGAMARAMARLLLDRPLRDRVAATARQRVWNDFDNRVHIQQLTDLYRREIPALSASRGEDG